MSQSQRKHGVGSVARAVMLAAAIGLCASGARAQPEIERRGIGPVAGAVQSGRAEKAKPGAGGTLSTVLPLAGVLSLVVAGGAVVRAIAKRGGLMGAMGAGGRAPSGILEVIGRYPVSRGCMLVLLKVDRRVLLLSQTATGRFGTGAAFQTLAEFNDADDVASILVKARDADGDSMAARFKGLLSKAESGFDSAEAPSARRVRRGAEGDRLETWDDARHEIPVVDLTRREETAGVSNLRQRLAGFAQGARR